MKTVMVTGASGFIGKRLLLHLLSKDYFVIAVVRDRKKLCQEFGSSDKLEIVECDLKDYNQLAKRINRSIEWVIHLAWEGSAGPKRADYHLQMKNVEAVVNCIVESGKLGCKHFMCTGTISENLIIGDSISLKSQNMFYAAAKLSAYYYAKVLCQTNHMEFIWCQLANIYGPGNETGNLMSYTIQSLLNGERPTYSSALVLQDFLYVDDCVRAISMLMEYSRTSSCYYIGTGHCRRLKDYLEEARDIINPSLELGIGERPDDGTVYLEEWFSMNALLKDTGFQTQTSFAEGIRTVMEYKKGKGKR